MKKLLVLMFLIFPLVGCAAVEEIGCLTQMGRKIPYIQTYPEDGAENVPPNSVVVVEHDGDISSFGISAVDVNDPEWKYVTGGNFEDDTIFLSVENGTFSENGEVIVTVEIGCYEPYEFRFTTGSMDDES